MCTLGRSEARTSFAAHGGFDAAEDQSCFSGGAGWASNHSGEYGEWRAGRLVSPVVDLSMGDGATASVTLAFRHFFRFEEPSQSRYREIGRAHF